MQINTKWFVTVEIDDAKVITFEKGLIGFEDCSRFAIVYETEDKKENAPEKTGYRVLAVTACPTGIAHTFMAAEALEKKGNEMGITIKVETNGSGGVKNRLTAKEIEECDGIIVAADKNVETARFDGKPVLFTKVAEGIHKPEELIN